jgi:hypothetical protein
VVLVFIACVRKRLFSEKGEFFEISLGSLRLMSS